jgi:D-alanyl-D-alanine carboxypeptidase
LKSSEANDINRAGRVAIRAKFLGAALIFVCAGSAAGLLGAAPASAEALLLLEAGSGKVLHAENAAYPWYPASLTKLMTLYVTLQAINERRLTPDTLITVSAKAAAQAPTKMGFDPGTKVTVDNALKMLMVKSANDMAVTLAEGVDGSVEAFADDMNATARRLGMVETSYVNPNGLPADRQITSARDLGILARALIHDFPEYEFYWHVPAIKFGRRVTRNYNKLLSSYPGADGMKTGYICASGFNMVATATRKGRQLIAVVLGAPSSSARALKAAQLLQRGFNGGSLAWLTPSLGTVNELTPIAAAPPNLRDEMCGDHRHRKTADKGGKDAVAPTGDSEGPSVMLSALQAPVDKSLSLTSSSQDLGEPIPVFVGAAKKPSRAELIAEAKAEAAAAPKPVPGRPLPILTGSVKKDATAKAAAGSVGLWTSLTATPGSRAPAVTAAAQVAAATVPLPRARPKIKSRRR